MFSKFTRSLSLTNKPEKCNGDSLQSEHVQIQNVSSWRTLSQRIIQERIRDGCLLPTPNDALEAAVKALYEKTNAVTPEALHSTERFNALLGVHHNNVPESLIVSCMSTDNMGEYLHIYLDNIQKCLDEIKISVEAASRIYENTYWHYLQRTTGVSIPISTENFNKKTKSTVLLFFSTISQKSIAKNPFKCKTVNSNYREAFQLLKEEMGAVQKYMYFMRPDDPMTHSSDTRVRLQEIAAYISTGYGWMLWFLDMLDLRVLKQTKLLFQKTQGPRSSVAPEDLFKRHLKKGPAVATGTGTALILAATTASSLTSLLKISSIWQNEWREGLSGTASAIVAAVELITCLHHHFQYLLNMMLVGYACWGDGGVYDSYILNALRTQGRFLYCAGDLVQTMSIHSWVTLESSIHVWFLWAVARSLLLYKGTPTAYYTEILNRTYPQNTCFLLPSPQCFRVNTLRSSVSNGVGLECVCLQGNCISNLDDSHVIGRRHSSVAFKRRSVNKRAPRVLVRPNTIIDANTISTESFHTKIKDVLDVSRPIEYTQVKAAYEGSVSHMWGGEPTSNINGENNVTHIYENVLPTEINCTPPVDVDSDSDTSSQESVCTPSDIPIKSPKTQTFVRSTFVKHRQRARLLDSSGISNIAAISAVKTKAATLK
ncbi:unknown [Cercopithecine alphaherpesvirus 9]|uniref:Tegument protein UL46 homolog n=1 Tax=Cercopithecine herpesvirus 9 (strain DHV) TaxID=36348 RepID=Q9E203_CHV9D|nr:tegument protein VP11/12 [Cercopithecine alphaherpesvirus 9]AAG27185.1 unknown [Cercopithecine alphaherpesvirus 9]